MLPDLVTAEAFRLLLIFVRIGSAMVIMPGLAEIYVAGRVRLLLAIGLSLALAGPLGPSLPAVPISRWP
jgi:flagellar biosynthetic protein FliR